MKRSTLTSRAPMKRSAWGRPAPAPREDDREARLEARATRAMAPSVMAGPATASVMARDLAGAKPVTVAPKEQAVRSEPYRRLVAAMPCAHCGAVGYSQHAHLNEGKGAGLKVDDRRAMPLCCTRPGIEGCHAAFDMYRLVPGGRDGHRAAGAAWAAQTREAIGASGKWPPSVPKWVD